MRKWQGGLCVCACGVGDSGACGVGVFVVRVGWGCLWCV